MFFIDRTDILIIICFIFSTSCAPRQDEQSKLIKEEGKFFKNKKHGYWTGHFPNNNLAYEGFCKAGLKDSVWKYYYDKGILYKVENYKENLRYGKATIYTERGNIYTQVTFENNKFHGPFVQYFDNGEVNFSTYNLEGKETGLFQLYYESGKHWVNSLTMNTISGDGYWD